MWAAADVEHLGPRDALVRARVAVGAAEERRRVRVGVQAGQPLRADASEALAGQLVDAVVGDLFRGLAHRHQAGPGEIEMGTFSDK